jgi:hypothetical protein
MLPVFLLLCGLAFAVTMVGLVIANLNPTTGELEVDVPATATAIGSPTASPTPTAGGEARYEVTVQLNTSVLQDDIDQVDTLLRAYDEHLDFLIMESFPPVGRALLATDAPDFCQTVEAELEAKSYVDDVSCRLA